MSGPLVHDVAKYSENCWAVESLNADNGEFYSAVFRGPDAETRARSYAGWLALPAPEPPTPFSGAARETVTP